VRGHARLHSTAAEQMEWTTAPTQILGLVSTELLFKVDERIELGPFGPSLWGSGPHG
jgi:hypothetical protein